MEINSKSGMPGRRHSVGALARAYADGDKAAEERHSEWGAVLLYRPLGFLIAPVPLLLGMPATAVTILSLLIALALPAVALRWGLLPLGLLAMLVLVLDCVDGTVARASGTVSRAGHYLDFITDIVFRACFYAAVGLLAVSQAPAPLRAWAPSCALVAALLAVAARLCRIYAERLTGTAPYGREAVSGGVAARIFSFVSGVDSLLPLAALALGFAGWLGWLVLWLLFYSALDFLYTQVAILRRLA
jgi:phosphatidylglycerophosphate synthase